MAIPSPLGRRTTVATLLCLTVVTGLVDAVSYLRLGHVFVANMTGNFVFLGFSADPHSGLSPVASIVAIVRFLAGALGGRRLATALAPAAPGFLQLSGPRPPSWPLLPFWAARALSPSAPTVTATTAPSWC